MPKNLFQDMVKTRGPRAEVRSPEIRKKPVPKYTPPRVEFQPPQEIIRETRKGRSHFGLWFIAAISIVFFIFALSFLFARAQVTVNPKIKDFTLNENLSAVKDVNQAGLAFDLVIISGQDTKQVAAGEEKDVAIPSRGTVFIYNTFSSAPQKLAINSKLEGSNGKIYKTDAEVVIPGVNTDGTPGKVALGIYGAEAGEEYNSGPLDFKISGFKGTSKDSKFYGRSQGAITGGFKGKSGTITDADKEVAFKELETSLKTKLLQKATDQIPDGFILFKDAAYLRVDEENVGFTSGAANVPVNIKGTLYGFLFNEKSLTQKIAKDNISNYDDSEVYIPNIKELTFAMPDQGISFSDIQNINFNISGPARIVWKFDAALFQAALLGKSKKDFNQILSQYPNVDSAQLSLSPFWVRTLPSKLKDIKVTVDYPVVDFK